MQVTYTAKANKSQDIHISSDKSQDIHISLLVPDEDEGAFHKAFINTPIFHCVSTRVHTNVNWIEHRVTLLSAALLKFHGRR